MRLLFTFLLFTFGLSAQQTAKTIDINGQTRNYLQYLPVNYQPSEFIPVVFVLHGLGSNAQQMSQAGFNQVADTARYIAIYPDGKNNAFGQAAWNNGTGLSSNVDDITFFNKMMDELILNNNVDPSRVYVSGFSMGSIMSYHLACALNNRIAAIGAMAGTMSTEDIQNCVPAYTTPVIHLHGTADGTVPYDSNPLPSLSLVPETIAFWQNVHGCSTTSDSIRIPDTAQDNITIDQFIYDNCNKSGALELWRFNDADHIYLFEPANDITEAKEVWKFFLRWTHPTPALANIKEGKKSSFSIFPVPSKSSITVSSPAATSAKIIDQKGRVLQTLLLEKGKNILKLDLEKGIYFLTSEFSTQKFIIN
jgi:polyhydroxybutyrate depolymerase